MCKIEYKLIELISLFTYLINNENFEVYKKILSKYNIVFENFQRNKINEKLNIEDYLPLQNVFRLYLEAPPKDKILGKYILDKMQDFYESYSALEDIM